MRRSLIQSCCRTTGRVVRTPYTQRRWAQTETRVADPDHYKDVVEHETLLPELRQSQQIKQIKSRLDGEDLSDSSFRSVDNWEVRNHQAFTTAGLGSNLEKRYEVYEYTIHPYAPEDISIEILLAAQAHLGHNTANWNPMNSKWIYGIRQGIHVISLEQTAAHLRRACRVVREVARHGGKILFVGTRKGQERAIVTASENTGGYHVFEKWKPGTITNKYRVLKGRALKVLDQHDNEQKDYEAIMHQLPAVEPDLVVCLNPLENWVLLRECSQARIPTIGIIDTNANPTWVTYPIPANDDSLRCTQLIAGVLGVAGRQGKKERLEMARRGEVLYQQYPQGDLDREEFQELLENARARAAHKDLEHKEYRIEDPKFWEDETDEAMIDEAIGAGEVNVDATPAQTKELDREAVDREMLFGEMGRDKDGEPIHKRDLKDFDLEEIAKSRRKRADEDAENEILSQRTPTVDDR